MFIGDTHGMMVMCKCDESSWEGGSKLSIVTDLKQFTHIHCVRVNFGALLTVVGDLEVVCCIDTSHGMMAMCKCDETSREEGRKSSKFTDLKQFNGPQIHQTSNNSPTSIVSASILEHCLLG